MEKKNVVLDKTYAFSLRIVKLSQFLMNEKKEFVLSKQILRSGTSVGANTEEAVGGISKKDFIAKLSISYKEARETHFWLRILKDSSYIEEQQFNSLITGCDEVLKILFSIIRSSRTNL